MNHNIDKLLEYKDYLGTVEYCAIDNILHGKVIGIRDLISYHGTCVDSIKRAFEEAIDHHLSYWEENGIKPQKTEGSNNYIAV